MKKDGGGGDWGFVVLWFLIGFVVVFFPVMSTLFWFFVVVG